MNTRLLFLLAAAGLLNSCRTSDADFGIEKLGLQTPPGAASGAEQCDSARPSDEPEFPFVRPETRLAIL